MPTDQGLDTSVITPVSAVTPAVTPPPMSTPAPLPSANPITLPTPIVMPEPPATSVAQAAPAIIPSSKPQVVAEKPPNAFMVVPPLPPDPASLPHSKEPATTQTATSAAPPITSFPAASEMLQELQASGSLQTNSPANAATTETPSHTLPVLTKPPAPPAIHLANTTQTFQRPTAEQLLEQAQTPPKAKNNYWFWIVLGIIALGAVGWIVYSQMRMSGLSASGMGSESLQDTHNQLNSY